MTTINTRETGGKNVRRNTNLLLMVLNRDRLCEELTLRYCPESH